MIRTIAFLIFLLMAAGTTQAQGIRVYYPHPYFYHPQLRPWPHNQIRQFPIITTPPRANIYFGGPVYNRHIPRYWNRGPQRPIPNNPQPVLNYVPLPGGKPNVMPRR